MDKYLCGAFHILSVTANERRVVLSRHFDRLELSVVEWLVTKSSVMIRWVHLVFNIKEICQAKTEEEKAMRRNRVTIMC